MRTTLQGAVAYYTENSPRGEYVLIVEGGEEAGAPTTPTQVAPEAALSPEERVTYYCEAQGISRMAAMKLVAKEMGISKSELYRMLLPETE